MFITDRTTAKVAVSRIPALLRLSLRLAYTSSHYTRRIDPLSFRAHFLKFSPTRRHPSLTLDLWIWIMARRLRASVVLPVMARIVLNLLNMS
jgi:hypothetical protein